MMLLFFFFNDTATTEIYTLSLHDALPILIKSDPPTYKFFLGSTAEKVEFNNPVSTEQLSETIHNVTSINVQSSKRSEEHTSELQSRQYLVCRLLLEKKKYNIYLTALQSTN